MVWHGYKLKFATIITKALKLSVLNLASKSFHNLHPPFRFNFYFPIDPASPEIVQAPQRQGLSYAPFLVLTVSVKLKLKAQPMSKNYILTRLLSYLSF